MKEKEVRIKTEVNDIFKKRVRRDFIRSIKKNKDITINHNSNVFTEIRKVEKGILSIKLNKL